MSGRVVISCFNCDNFHDECLVRNDLANMFWIIYHHRKAVVMSLLVVLLPLEALPNCSKMFLWLKQRCLGNIISNLSETLWKPNILKNSIPGRYLRVEWPINKIKFHYSTFPHGHSYRTTWSTTKHMKNVHSAAFQSCMGRLSVEKGQRERGGLMGNKTSTVGVEYG